MSTALVEQLLALQERDVKRRSLEHELAQIPREVSALEAKIVSEEAALEAGEAALRELEVRRNDLEGQIQAAEEQINRYKTQQLGVKKNEEYQALDHQIATSRVGVSELEDEEIAVLLEIDEGRERWREEEAARREEIRRLRARIELLREKEERCRQQIDDAVRAYEEAESTTDPGALQVYASVKTSVRKPPFLAQLEGHKCRGCYLRVSNEVDELTRVDGKLPRCDSCGRIVYR